MATPVTGRFVWHELHTTDRQKALKFYSQLIGWQTKEENMGNNEIYGLCNNGSEQVAGVMTSKAPANIPPHWLPYMAVENVDTYAKKAQELGGKIMMPAMDIPNVGRFAVITDPQGAAFAIFKDAKGTNMPEVDRPPVGSFCWDELMTTDPAAAAKFYASLFGYTVQEQDMGPMGTYRILKRGDKQTAGVMKTQQAGMPPAWLTYIAVKDVDATTRNAKELGAKTIVEPKDIPNIGRFSFVSDVTGAAIGFFKGA